MTEKLNPDAIAEWEDWDPKTHPDVQPVTEGMILAYVVQEGELPSYSARPFAKWLFVHWNGFTDDEDRNGTQTNGDVIQGALADWRGE